MSDYFDMIARRQSCRSYGDRPVEREKLEKCVEAARLAPSACNGQPWKYIVVTRPETVEALRPCLQGMGMNKFADGCAAFAVVTEVASNLSATVGARFQRQDFASIDIGLSVSQFCYAALEQGLSTCILGWLNEKKIKALLSLPESCRVRLVLCVGYAAEGDPLRKKVRKSTEEMASFMD